MKKDGQRPPPATAGRTVTVSPSLSGVSRPDRKRTSSSLRYTLTKRRRSPPLSISRSRRPPCRCSKSVNSSPSVDPVPSTCLAPSVYVRRIVGMRTSMAIEQRSTGLSGRSLASNPPPAGIIPPESFHHGDGLLGDHAVGDPEGAELGRVLVPRGDQHVVRLRLAGVGDVGAGRVRLGGGVRVVDDDGFLVVIVHLAPDPELLGRVEAVEGRGPFGVHHGDEPLGAVAPGRAGDDAAGLVRVVGTGMGHDLVVQRTRDGQHDQRAYEGVGGIAGGGAPSGGFYFIAWTRDSCTAPSQAYTSNA